ncbi:SDR family NAD(P)-dependent oxidoreductase [Glaciecola sp. 2405UD65-10]|uniref:SDR family NAD(P)-dependent oxidoreductase n=1 Tax=Glaciecola sp. 2405UD65-10 TaxID=3397244 RepID=UPI003B5CFF72
MTENQNLTNHQINKTLVITGASSGIGLAIAKYFDTRNYNVFNLDIVPSTVGTFIECSVTNQAQVNEEIARIGKAYGIDVLISNAGVHFSGNIENTNNDDFERVLNINVKGAYYATRAAIPFMRAQNSGSIIYIGSDQSLVAKQNSFIYGLTKHALASMAKSTALDYAKFNVRANIICPGTIETPLYHAAINRYCEKSGEEIDKVHAEEALQQPLGRIGQAEDVAALAYFLASDEASFITGSSYPVDGGYTAG